MVENIFHKFCATGSRVGKYTHMPIIFSMKHFPSSFIRPNNCISCCIGIGCDSHIGTCRTATTNFCGCDFAHNAHLSIMLRLALSAGVSYISIESTSAPLTVALREEHAYMSDMLSFVCYKHIFPTHTDCNAHSFFFAYLFIQNENMLGWLFSWLVGLIAPLIYLGRDVAFWVAFALTMYALYHDNIS